MKALIVIAGEAGQQRSNPLRPIQKIASSLTFLAMTLVLLVGCQTAPAKPSGKVSALTTMAQGLTNQPVTETDLRHLALQARNDPQAQSAIHSLKSSFSVEHRVKYCPVDGQRFSANVDICPIHKVKLKWVE